MVGVGWSESDGRSLSIFCKGIPALRNSSTTCKRYALLNWQRVVLALCIVLSKRLRDSLNSLLGFFIFACLSRAFWRQHDFKVCSFQSLEAPCKRHKTVNRFEDTNFPREIVWFDRFDSFFFWIWCTSFAIFSFSRFQNMLPRDWGSLYDIAWRTRSVRRGSVRRGGRHLLSKGLLWDLKSP